MAERETSKKSATSSLFFSDGCIVGQDAIVVAGHFNAYPDADATRVTFRFGHEWTYSDCRNDMLRAVTYSPEEGKCFLAGRNGVIRTYGSRGVPFTLSNVKGSMTETSIPDVEQYGEIFGLRAFGGQVFCCGQSAQVHSLQHGIWVHADEGMLSQHAQTLEDIDGTGPDDIYAVGMAGTIVHFDGRRWQKMDSPTNLPLSGVRCIDRDSVYICGNEGILLRGNARGWEAIGSSDLRMNFWGIEVIDDTIYLAHVRGIITHRNGVFSEVQLPTKKKITCNKLHASGDHLLSVGVDDVWLFDGTSWNEIVWPDNQMPR